MDNNRTQDSTQYEVTITKRYRLQIQGDNPEDANKKALNLRSEQIEQNSLPTWAMNPQLLSDTVTDVQPVKKSAAGIGGSGQEETRRSGT